MQPLVLCLLDVGQDVGEALRLGPEGLPLGELEMRLHLVDRLLDRVPVADHYPDLVVLAGREVIQVALLDVPG